MIRKGIPKTDRFNQLNEIAEYLKQKIYIIADFVLNSNLLSLNKI